MSDRELNNAALQDDSGAPLRGQKARLALMDELAKGRKVLPTGACEGFSYETGCPGHETPEVA